MNFRKNKNNLLPVVVDVDGLPNPPKPLVPVVLVAPSVPKGFACCWAAGDPKSPPVVAVVVVPNPPVVPVVPRPPNVDVVAPKGLATDRGDWV